MSDWNPYKLYGVHATLAGRLPVLGEFCPTGGFPDGPLRRRSILYKLPKSYLDGVLGYAESFALVGKGHGGLAGDVQESRASSSRFALAISTASGRSGSTVDRHG